MAKISLLGNDGAGVNNSGLTRSKDFPIDAINLHDEFRKMFQIDENTLGRITESIKNNGFDITQPLHLWECEKRLYLLDGHTRLLASIAAGLAKVPGHIHTEIQTFDQAYAYALRLQVNRRNLSEGELLAVIEMLAGDVQKTKDLSGEISGRLNDKIAEQVDISPRTVQKYRTVLKEGSDEMKDKIAKGELSVNKAYKSVKGESSRAKKANELKVDLEDIRDRVNRLLSDANEKLRTVDDKKDLADIISFLLSILKKELTHFKV